ncbi:MAG TPA: glycosyltransferase family 39 protein, partial [Roseiflexaceae bacterium]|nr:glycosyltransferase family 39 protein [Roseiflexaceae bacterium]
MAVQLRAAAQTRQQNSATFWVFISYVVIGLVALKLRVRDLGGFVTFDEINFWIQRSQVFLSALRSGDYGATAISTHPGVTTMWLGSAGLLLHTALRTLGVLADDSFATRLALLRLPVVLVHVGGIVLGYRLLRRLMPAATAALAAFLWATDPFLVGYSQLLHVDALAGTFATLSLLAACEYWYVDRRSRSLLLSAVCAGLAFLSKSPALALVPVVGLLALLARYGERDRHQPSELSRVASVVHGSPLRALILWAVLAAAVVFIG